MIFSEISVRNIGKVLAILGVLSLIFLATINTASYAHALDFSECEEQNVLLSDEVEIEALNLNVDPCPEPGKIIIEKVTEPATTTAEFEFDGSWDGTFTIVGEGSEEFTVKSETTYSVEEINLPDGWTLESVECKNTTSGETLDETDDLYVIPGQVITCIFTNSYEAPETGLGSITIEKVVDDADTTEWSFNLDIYTSLDAYVADFTLSNDDPSRTFTDMEEGTYIVGEAFDPALWDLAGVVCDDDDSTIPELNGKLHLMLSAGENVKCIFTNIKLPGEDGGNNGGGGNNDDDDDVTEEEDDEEGGITTGSRSRSSSSSSSSSSSDDDSDGEVLGEAITVMPAGAPNTGAGGTAPLSINLPVLNAILSGNAAVRKVQNG